MQVYLTKNNIDGMMYIGRDAKDNKKYFGSGKYFKRAIKKYGKHNFTKHIIQQLPENRSFDDLIKAEQYWLTKLNCANDSRFYNISSSSKGINKNFHHDVESKIKMRLAKLGKIKSICPNIEEFVDLYVNKKMLMKELCKKYNVCKRTIKKWLLNSEIKIRTLSETKKGRFKHTQKHKQHVSKIIHQLKWFIDPVSLKSIRCKPGFCPFGYIPGRKVKGE